MTLVGHRYPLLDSHSGLILGSDDKYGHLSHLHSDWILKPQGKVLPTGILLAGAVTVLLAAFNLIYIIQK